MRVEIRQNMSIGGKNLFQTLVSVFTRNDKTQLELFKKWILQKKNMLFKLHFNDFQDAWNEKRETRQTRPCANTIWDSL